MFYKECIEEFIKNDSVDEIVAGKDYRGEFRFLKRGSIDPNINLEAVFLIGKNQISPIHVFEKFSFYGYIKDGIIYTDEYIRDEDKIPEIRTLSELTRFVKKELTHNLEERINLGIKDWNNIPDLSDYDIKELQSMFDEGCSPYNDDYLKEYAIREAATRIDSEVTCNYSLLIGKFDDLCDETELRIKESYCRKIARNNFLKELTEKGRNKTQVLTKLLKDLYIEGKRTVNAIFDFGYETVEQKLYLSSSLSNNYVFFGGTQKAHDAFRRMYVQPLKMNSKYGDNIEYLEYIKEIKVGKKVVYTDDCKLENIAENQLLNLIYRSNEKNFNEQIIKVLKDNTLDIDVLNKAQIVYKALTNFYISMDVFKELEKSGCDMTSEEVINFLSKESYSTRGSRYRLEFKEEYL